MFPPFNHQRIFLKNVHPVFAWMVSWPHIAFNSVLFPFLSFFFFLIALTVWRVSICSRLVIPVFFNCVSWQWVGMYSSPSLTQTSEFIFSFSKSLGKQNRWQCARLCRVVFNTTINPFVRVHIERLQMVTPCYSLWNMMQVSHALPMVSVFSLCFMVPSTRFNIDLW